MINSNDDKQMCIELMLIHINIIKIKHLINLII